MTGNNTPVLFHSEKIILPQGFVEDDGHRVAQIQGPLALPHGDADGMIGVFRQQLLGQARRLLAEDQEVPVLKGRVRVPVLGVGGGVEEPGLRVQGL